MSKLKVLVVDDSVLMRTMISDMINNDPSLEVIDTAKNGWELLDKLSVIKPDVITLDVEMPRMNGIEVLQALKSRGIGIPVIIISSYSKSGADITIRCLELGAFDFISKPSEELYLSIDTLKQELISKIKATALHKTSVVSYDKQDKIRKPVKKGRRVSAIVIGASSGGPKAIYSLITSMPGDIGVPIFVVQHMPVGFTKAFADRLNSHSSLTVQEANHGDEIIKNTVYIAPGGQHLEIASEKALRTSLSPPCWGVRPAVDNLFTSAAEIYKDAVISVVLTGMGRDGALGTERIKAAGGYTISEHQSTCTIYGMPKATYETGAVDEVLPLYEIPGRLMELLKL